MWHSSISRRRDRQTAAEVQFSVTFGACHRPSADLHLDDGCQAADGPRPAQADQRSWHSTSGERLERKEVV